MVLMKAPKTPTHEELPPAADRLEASRRQLVETWSKLGHVASDREMTDAWTEPIDIAQEAVERDTTMALQRLLAELREDVEHALLRLEEGGYGTCEDCLRPIPAERLRARPEAVRCVGCQRSYDLHRLGGESPAPLPVAS